MQLQESANAYAMQMQAFDKPNFMNEMMKKHFKSQIDEKGGRQTKHY